MPKVGNTEIKFDACPALFNDVFANQYVVSVCFNGNDSIIQTFTWDLSSGSNGPKVSNITNVQKLASAYYLKGYLYFVSNNSINITQFSTQTNI